MSEKKHYTAEEVLNLQAQAYQKGYNEGYQLRKKEHPEIAVWVKASDRLPKASGRITWRWLDKADAYAGYDEKRGFIFGTHGASVDPDYYGEIEWYDESTCEAKKALEG